MSKKDTGWDSPENEVQSNWMKFNVPLEDKLFGTLIAKRQIKSTMPGKEGELVNIYEIKASEETSFHVLDEKKKLVDEAITINPGDVYSVGGTKVIDNQMRNIKVGQVIGFKFIEEQPSKTKGFAPAKIVKVFVPKGDDGKPQMDEEFLASRGGDLASEFNDD